MTRSCDSGASDEELLVRTASEPEAFGVFYDRFEAAVLGFFFRATRRADLAADLTAEVFAAALASAAGFDPLACSESVLRQSVSRGLRSRAAA
jgi:DNA-directed RNA polymerase specialized sigma24 family protein